MYDDANEDEPQDDDEKALQEALALSILPAPADKTAEAKPEQPGQENKEGQQPAAGGTENVALDTNLLKDVIGDLGIDLYEGQLEDIVKEATNKNEGEDKDKKDDKGQDKN